ncbi:MAG: RNA-directed DNA polymerase, partial [Balneolaceae bacterium]
MSITDKNIIELRDAFQKLKTKEDLIQLLNRSNFFLYGEKSEDFKLKSLTYYSNPRLSGDCYIEFKINKKSGGQRVIHAPNKGLKAIQGALNLVLQSVYEPHIAATGFVRNKSIVDNARKHVGKHYVFNTDLKDFFPSIDQARFWGRLQYPPFNLNEDYGKLEIANRISALCFTNLEVDRKINGKWIKEIKPVLPQGAPTSPTISNIIAESLDRKLTGLADRFGCVYTRYADD